MHLSNSYFRCNKTCPVKARLEKYGGRGVFVRGVRFSEFYSAQGFRQIFNVGAAIYTYSNTQRSNFSQGSFSAYSARLSVRRNNFLVQTLQKRSSIYHQFQKSTKNIKTY